MLSVGLCAVLQLATENGADENEEQLQGERETWTEGVDTATGMQ